MNLSEKQKGKRPESSLSPLPPIPKRSRTKVQDRKVTPDARVSQKLKVTKNSQASIHDSSIIHQKVHRLIPDDKLHGYVKEFLNKYVEFEYFANKLVEYEIGVKFLAALK